MIPPRTTKLTLKRYTAPGAGTQTYTVCARTTGEYLGLLHWYPGNAALDLAACWMATHRDCIREFPPEAFRQAVAHAAGHQP